MVEHEHEHEHEHDFGGGPGVFATWDGQPVSREPPHGASAVVLAESPDGWRVLVLRRARSDGSVRGDWVWTPPSGARLPGEDVRHCAERELAEEAGIRATCSRIASQPGWETFGVVVAWGTPVRIDGTEHDRYEWLTPAEALARCQPAVVSEAIDAVLVAFDVHRLPRGAG